MTVQNECNKQLVLKQRFESEGLSLIEDPHGLADSIGTEKMVSVTFAGFTPKGLCKFYIQDEPNEEAFHIIAPNRLDIPSENLIVGKLYQLRCVIGVRKVSGVGYVISLRLPPAKREASEL